MKNYNFKRNSYDSTKQYLSLFEISKTGKTGPGFFAKKELYKNKKKYNSTVNTILKEFKGKIISPGQKHYFINKIDYKMIG